MQGRNDNCTQLDFAAMSSRRSCQRLGPCKGCSIIITMLALSAVKMLEKGGVNVAAPFFAQLQPSWLFKRQLSESVSVAHVTVFRLRCPRILTRGSTDGKVSADVHAWPRFSRFMSPGRARVCVRARACMRALTKVES